MTSLTACAVCAAVAEAWATIGTGIGGLAMIGGLVWAIRRDLDITVAVPTGEWAGVGPATVDAPTATAITWCERCQSQVGTTAVITSRGPLYLCSRCAPAPAGSSSARCADAERGAPCPKS